MKKHILAFVDLETTGLDPTVHEIVEIGIVLAEQREDLFGRQSLHFISEHEILLAPEHIDRADPKALQVNKYYDRDRSNALAQKDGLRLAEQLLAKSIFIAQNVAFDWSFLQFSGKRYGVDFDRALYYHKLDLASMAFGKFYHDPKLFRFSLRELTEFFMVKNQDAHSALSDAKATFEACQKLLDSK